MILSRIVKFYGAETDQYVLTMSKQIRLFNEDQNKSYLLIFLVQFTVSWRCMNMPVNCVNKTWLITKVLQSSNFLNDLATEKLFTGLTKSRDMCVNLVFGGIPSITKTSWRRANWMGRVQRYSHNAQYIIYRAYKGIVLKYRLANYQVRKTTCTMHNEKTNIRKDKYIISLISNRYHVLYHKNAIRARIYISKPEFERTIGTHASRFHGIL